MVLGTTFFVALAIRDAGLAGLAITSALSLVSIMNWATRQATNLEMGMNSVERLTEYLEYDSERPAIVEGNRCRCFWHRLILLVACVHAEAQSSALPWHAQHCLYAQI